MPCFHPRRGYRARRINKNSGKRSIVFNTREGFEDLPVTVPCGQCVGCRLDRSLQWAVRCVHEAQLHEDNCFITLTYDDEHLPKHRSLKKKDFQDFMKRLRFYMSSGRADARKWRKKFGVVRHAKPIRYYQCGEYGEKFGRPHYHAIMFGLHFADQTYLGMSRPGGFSTAGGSKLFKSAALTDLWRRGHCSIGTVTFQSAAYVARYIMKKVNGKNALLHYNDIDLQTGEILAERVPEYTNMSRKPGIAMDWLKKFGFAEVFPDDFVVIDGKKRKVPKYYDRQYEVAYPSDFEKIKCTRRSNAKAREGDNTPDRLAIKEHIKMCQLKQLKRGLDNG